MKTLITLAALLTLGGCSTLIPEEHFTFPSPPQQLMVPPQPLVPLKPGADGAIDPQTALSGILKNNKIAKQNADELGALQGWVKQTSKNVAKINKK